jgi:hypothetical protein
MCDICTGSASATQQQYTVIKAKAKQHAMEKNTDVVIYHTYDGQPDYMEAKAFATYQPGQFFEFVTPLAIA